MKKKLGNKPFVTIWVIVFMVLISIVGIANWAAFNWGVALTQYFGTVGGKTEIDTTENIDTDYFKSSYDNYEAFKAEMLAACEEIIGEGTVLLKNDENTLPLSNEAKISIFGVSSVNPVLGGTGSGSVAASRVATIKESMEKAGFSVNPVLWDFYETGEAKSYGNGSGANLSGGSSWSLNEAPQSVYTDEVRASYEDYKDAAIIILTRNNGEGADLPRNMANDGGDVDKHYLELTEEEKELLKAVNDTGYDKIILLVNASSTLELDFVNAKEYGIDSCLLVSGPGEAGFDAVADIIAGKVTPSGRLADTYAADALGSPAMQNFGEFEYPDVEKYIAGTEGIYVGYKYYETRYEDVIMGTPNVGDYNYADEVVYPFGYGLSYAEFEWSDYTMSEPDADGNITINIKITNKSEIYAGKEVVQIYYQSPYTDYDKDNKIEKSAVDLVTFAKTDILQPGESADVTLTFNLSEMVSYDAYGAKTYILDKGRYYVTAARDAHEAVNNILGAKGYSVSDGMTFDGNVSMTGFFDRDNIDITTYSVDPITGVSVTNLFEAADLTNEASLAYDASYRYLTRNDWSGTFPAPYGTETEGTTDNALGYQYSTEASSELAAMIRATEYEASGNPASKDSYTMPITEANNGMELIELRGEPYDSEKWEPLLDQLLPSELTTLVGLLGYQTPQIRSINMPAAIDIDGPAGLNSFVGDLSGTGIPSEVVVAYTWNVELINKLGELIGDEGLYLDIQGWYAPAINIHRTPFGGRFYEYFSEDPVLSGMIASAEVKGVQSKGMTVFIKHFAFNEQETNRAGVCTWLNEQAIREIYLRPFKIAVEDNFRNGTMAIMTSYNRIGATWTGGSYNLITGVLRNEWGFNGLVLTDYSAAEYMDTDQMLAAGGDGQLSTSKRTPTDSTSPAGVSLMRYAAKNILYTVVNSSAMNGIAPGAKIISATPIYYFILAALDTITLVIVFIGVLLVRKRVLKYEQVNE